MINPVIGIEGEKVVCVKEKALSNKLIIGRLFTIREVTLSGSGKEYWTLISDDGDKCGWIETNYFKPLSEIREDKLRKLGI